MFFKYLAKQQQLRWRLNLTEEKKRSLSTLTSTLTESTSCVWLLSDSWTKTCSRCSSVWENVMTRKFWGEKKSSEDQRSDQSELTATRSQWGGPNKTLSPHTKVNVWNTADTATCFWIHFSFEWLSGPLWSSLTELPPTLLPSLHKGQIGLPSLHYL